MTVTAEAPEVAPASWADLPLTPEHAAYLRDQAAITPDVARAAGVRSVTQVDQLPEALASWGEMAVPGIVFPWVSGGGQRVEQVKPDAAVVWDGEERKYLWPADESSILNAARVLDDDDRVLIVEGTKQQYAAASYAPDGVSVYGIAGCRSWSTNGVPLPDLAVVEGKKAYICLDGDVASNFEVYDAAEKLGAVLRDEGATAVLYVWINAGKKTGLDDLLATKAPERRADFLAGMLDRAEKKPARTKPRPTRVHTFDDGGRCPADRFFDDSGLLVEDLSVAIRDRNPTALTEEREIALYRGGVYHIDGTAFSGTVAELLGNRFRPGHRAAVEEFTVGFLYNAGLYLPIHNDQPLLNVRNGMLDLATGTLKPHDPSYLSGQQIPIEWDPDAKCPTYESWVKLCGVADQIDDLEETTATMLDPSRTPPKAVFLFGPSRSGKSTYLRLKQAMVGTRNFSAVTLHQLAANRFAAANVFGKMLNCAADLSSAHVEDLSIFKMMTGEDPIQADRKNGAQFPFINRALFAFSANELPTVGESSRAYTERIKPFEFPISFAGRENPEIEETMLREELPGILVRWVRAWQRRTARGTYLPTDPRIMKDFETRSDRVRQWLEERCRVWTETPDGRPIIYGSTVPADHALTRAELANAFNRWAEENNGSKMGQRKIVDRLLTVREVVDVRRLPSKAKALNVTVRKGDSGVWENDDEPDSPGGGFEALGGGFNGSGGDFGNQIATENPLVTNSGSAAVAEVAISRPTTALSHGNTESLAEVDLTEGNQGSGDTVSARVAHSGLEIATSATLATGTGNEDALTPGTPEFLASSDPDTKSDGPAVAVLPLERVANSTLPDGVVALDIETASEEQLFRRGPEFVRLCGYQRGDQVRVTTDAAELAEVIKSARMIVGHNIMAFDLVAFARNYGVDLRQLAAEGRVFDTKLAGILNDPPSPGSKQAQIQRAYSLDSLGAKMLGSTKTGDLKALAKEFGGFDQIPVDDERYVTYLVGDVDLTARLAAELKTSDYVRREHRVAAIAAQIRMNGFRVDVDELTKRVAAGRARRAELLQRLTEQYNLPTTKKDGKPSKSPHATAEGKAAIVRAFTDLGVELPPTPNGNPSFGKPALEQVAEAHADDPAVMALVETVQSLNGVRTVYETIDQYRVADRVHPEIGMFQASGRWSTIKPGLTVMGKRGGRYVEREVYLPEPGHVNISADLAQVDARAIAALSQDPAYLALFRPGIDSHREVAQMVWGDPDRRDDAKAIGHGWNYGMGIAGLSRNAKVSEDVAREFDRAMREQFPRLVEWRDEVRQRGQAGELLDNGFGRMMRPDPDRSWTQSPALMGQGCARDLMMQGLLNLPAETHQYLRAVVHDEIVLSVPEDIADDVERDVLDALSFEWAPPGGSLSVQIEAGLGERRGRNWGHVYEKTPKP